LRRTDAIAAQIPNISALRDFAVLECFASLRLGFIASLASPAQWGEVLRRSPELSPKTHSCILLEGWLFMDLDAACAEPAQLRRPREGLLLIRFGFQSIDRSPATLYSGWWHLAK
jgi:hypothetical protein